MVFLYSFFSVGQFQIIIIVKHHLLNLAFLVKINNLILNVIKLIKY